MIRNACKEISAYQEIGRDFAKGDRMQFTAPSRDLGVANRDLATIEKIHEGAVTARPDGKDKTVNFRVQDMRHFNHGYAMTSHSSQGAALNHAVGQGNHHAPEPARVQEVVQRRKVDQGMSFGL